MRRHLIVGRFGPTDKAKIPSADGEVTTFLEFVKANSRLEHGIGRALEDLKKLKVYPSEIGLDLLVVAAHIHAADTRISRATESQDSWTRELRIVVPVSDVARWNAASGLVQRMLNFLTGDRWTIGFRPRPKGFEKAVTTKPASLTMQDFENLSLFSGGLDSLIGAIDALEQGRTPLFVSHAGEGATSDAQSTLFDALKKHYTKRKVERLRIWMNFPNGLVEDVESENTTRGRSFLFFAGAVFAGTGLASKFTIGVPENGLIALNVPLDPLRLGALSTRTTHPFYMARWNELIRALGIDGQVTNPYWNQTKGEMVAGCSNKDILAKLIPESLSCASPTKERWHGRGTGHCGYCLPCLIRRAALRMGLSTKDATPYTLDLKSRTLDTLDAEGQQVRAFQFAIARLKKKPQLARFLIHKPGPLSDESDTRQAELAEVYRRGLDEVASLLVGVQTAPG